MDDQTVAERRRQRLEWTNGELCLLQVNFGHSRTSKWRCQVDSWIDESEGQERGLGYGYKFGRGWLTVECHTEFKKGHGGLDLMT